MRSGLALAAVLCLAACGPQPPAESGPIQTTGPRDDAQLIRVCGPGAVIVEDPGGQNWVSSDAHNGLGDHITLWVRIARRANIDDICKRPR